MNKKSVYRKDLVNLGIVKVGDIITDNNLFLHEDPYVPISPEQRIGKRLLDLLSVQMK